MVMTMISVGISCLVTNLCLAKVSCDQPFVYSAFTFLNIQKQKKIVGEPDHTVKPYAAVVEELCYESQRLIPMPEK